MYTLKSSGYVDVSRASLSFLTHWNEQMLRRTGLEESIGVYHNITDAMVAARSGLPVGQFSSSTLETEPLLQPHAI